MLDRQITDQELKKLRRGVELEDGFAKVRSADIIEGSKRKKVCITLREGRNREVRRIFKALGHEVRQLDRVSFAGLTSFGLPRGRWRFLSREEISHLKQLTRLVN